MVQVYEKDVLKSITTIAGEPCVLVLSMKKKRELFATCLDTGRLMLSLI